MSIIPLGILAAAVGGSGGGGDPPPITVTANTYDGTNDYLTRGDLVGNADGKTGILSLFIDLNGGDGADMRIVAATGATVFVERDSSNKFHIICKNSAGTTILELWTTITYVASGGWIHLLASWDLANAKTHLYITDVDREDTGLTIKTNDTIDYTVTNWAIGAATNGVQKVNACLTQVYFKNTYLDFSVTANRRKFITSLGKPADLGTDGSDPTGAIPLIFLKTGDEVNSGTGGNFTVTGVLTACATSPSD